MQHAHLYAHTHIENITCNIYAHAPGVFYVHITRDKKQLDGDLLTVSRHTYTHYYFIITVCITQLSFLIAIALFP